MKMEYQVKCSFCGRGQDQIKKLISGPNGIYICDECVETCKDILDDNLGFGDYGDEEEELTEAPLEMVEEPSHDKQPFALKLLKPMEIKAFLDEYVIGQEEAKKSLSVAVYNHYKRVLSAGSEDDDGVELQKSNVLIMGPTGSGKTYLAQTLAKIIGVPFAIADATTLTEAGYVGEDVENILLRLIQAAEYDLDKASCGIIYIDEIDKITRKSENVSITRDVSGEGVQQALLKIIEGTQASVPPQGGRKHPHQELLTINTKDILFICGGAFEGLDKIIERRLNRKSIGFGAEIGAGNKQETIQLLSKVAPQDLVKFGLIPEFVGRVPVTVALDALDEQALQRILREPKSALIKQYQKLFRFDDVELSFEDEAVEEIARQAHEQKTGARGLRTIMEKLMLDVMYEIPSEEHVSRCIITRDAAEGREKPRLEKSA